MWVSVYKALDSMCDVCYSVLAVYCALGGWWGWVMRILRVLLTYKTLKTRANYHVNKKNFPQVKNALDFFEELEYIRICLWEVLDILGSHMIKKFSRIKNGL